MADLSFWSETFKNSYLKNNKIKVSLNIKYISPHHFLVKSDNILLPEANIHAEYVIKAL